MEDMNRRSGWLVIDKQQNRRTVFVYKRRDVEKVYLLYKNQPSLVIQRNILIPFGSRLISSKSEEIILFSLKLH